MGSGTPHVRLGSGYPWEPYSKPTRVPVTR